MTSPSAPGSYGLRRRRTLQRQRQRAYRYSLQQVRIPIAPQTRDLDPLAHRMPRGWFYRGVVLIFLIASAGAHLLLLFLGLAAGSLLGIQRVISEDTPVEIRMVDPPPVVQTQDSLTEEDVEEPGAQETVTPREDAKPRPKGAPTDLSDDPTDLPEEEKAQPEPAKEPIRRVVGIDYESTVEGGDGPTMAVGNTRMGHTGSVAEDPNSVPNIPKQNRRSVRVPTAGTKISKPRIKSNGGHRFEPAYPKLLAAQGIESEVVVVVTIGTDGKVKAVELAKPSPHREFNQAAQSAALKEEYYPALRSGEPIPYTLKYTYRFRLRNGQPRVTF